MDVIHGSEMLTALKAPGRVETRWLTEDVPYGLMVWAKLGDWVGIETPTMDSLATLASAVLERDFGCAGRSVTEFLIQSGGLANL